MFSQARKYRKMKSNLLANPSLGQSRPLEHVVHALGQLPAHLALLQLHRVLDTKMGQRLAVDPIKDLRDLDYFLRILFFIIQLL
jgi:hypothetical protein